MNLDSFTFFEGMLNDPIQNAADTLVGPVMMSFNTINNLFGIGTSSMMSRNLGAGAYEAVQKSSVFGFWAHVSALFAWHSYLFIQDSVLVPFRKRCYHIGSNLSIYAVDGKSGCSSGNLECDDGPYVPVGRQCLADEHRTMSGCILNMILDPFFILPQSLNMGATGAGFATFISNCFACG